MCVCVCVCVCVCALCLWLLTSIVFGGFIWWLLKDCLYTALRLWSLPNSLTSLYYWVQRTALSWETSNCSDCVKRLSHLLKAGRNTCKSYWANQSSLRVWVAFSELWSKHDVYPHGWSYMLSRMTKEWLKDPVEEKATLFVSLTSIFHPKNELLKWMALITRNDYEFDAL